MDSTHLITLLHHEPLVTALAALFGVEGCSVEQHPTVLPTGDRVNKLLLQSQSLDDPTARLEL